MFQYTLELITGRGLCEFSLWWLPITSRSYLALVESPSRAEVGMLALPQPVNLWRSQNCIVDSLIAMTRNDYKLRSADATIAGQNADALPIHTPTPRALTTGTVYGSGITQDTTAAPTLYLRNRAPPPPDLAP